MPRFTDREIMRAARAAGLTPPWSKRNPNPLAASPEALAVRAQLIAQLEGVPTMPTLPTIHPNGTSHNELFESTLKAMSAVWEAIRAVEATAPNGRDYYPQGPDALREAEREHAARVAALRDVRAQLEVLAVHIAGTAEANPHPWGE
jgi:hypothetical protein